MYYTLYRPGVYTVVVTLHTTTEPTEYLYVYVFNSILYPPTHRAYIITVHDCTTRVYIITSRPAHWAQLRAGLLSLYTLQTHWVYIYCIRRGKLKYRTVLLYLPTPLSGTLLLYSTIQYSSSSLSAVKGRPAPLHSTEYTTTSSSILIHWSVTTTAHYTNSATINFAM